MPKTRLIEGLIVTDRLTLYTLRSTPPEPVGRVLLLGGSNSDLRLKRRFLETELAMQFEVLTYEPRGIGRTSQPDGPWSMVDFADDAAALMDAVGWDSAHVLGESFGGMTALHLAQGHPKRVSRMALASATAGGAGGGSADIAPLLNLPGRAAAATALKLLDTDYITLEVTDPEAFEARICERMAFDTAFAEPSVTSGGYRRLLAARATHDIWECLDEIAHDTVVISGARDAQAPRTAQDAMANRLPNGRQWVFECGHGVAFATAEPMRALCTDWTATASREHAGAPTTN